MKEAEGSSEVPTVPLSGRLDGIMFPDLLWGLCAAQRSGTLRVGPPGTARTLFLDAGRIVQAASDLPDDRIGSRLLRQGLVTLDQLERAVNRQNLGRRLDSLLVETGALAPDQLIEGVRDQIRAIAFALFGLEHGDYDFVDGAIPVFEAPVEVDARELILEGSRQERSLRRMQRRVGTPGTIWALASGWKERIAGIELGESENMLVDRLQYEPASLDDLFHELLFSNFEIYQSLWAMQILGVAVTIGVRPGPADEGDTASDEGQGFAEHLLVLCNAGETGLLVARRNGIERSFHLQEGRCTFATSSNPDDSLISFLLRRGVISLRDADEAVRRMLTNKRIGTILLEIGVIDDSDLNSMVRDQVTEIVCDTFAWDTGEYAFVSESLPSDEAITIALDLEALVMSGLRRVQSWTRVRLGLGGLGSTLALTPRYLDVLDRMLAGEHEWAVVTALKDPATGREICRDSGLGDFETCRILWALRLLGAIEVTQVQEDDAALGSMIPESDEVEPSHLAVTAEAEMEADDHVEVTVEIEELPVDAPSATGSEESSVGEEPEGRFQTIAVKIDEDESDPPDAVILELERTTRTVPISPEEIASAIAGPQGDVAGDLADDVAFQVSEVEVQEFDEEEEVTLAVASQPTVDDEADDGVSQAEHETLAVDSESEREAEGEIDAGSEQGLDGEEIPEWDPPAELDEYITRFNTMQRVIYRVVRTEIGAGASNFIRSCCFGGREVDALAGVELGPDGTWDVQALRGAVLQHRIEDPWPEYERVIAGELDLLRQHIGEVRAAELRKKIERVDEFPRH